MVSRTEVIKPNRRWEPTRKKTRAAQAQRSAQRCDCAMMPPHEDPLLP